MLMQDALHLVMIRDQLPDLSQQVFNEYCEVVRLRGWYLSSEARIDASQVLIAHFIRRYDEVRRRLNVLSTIYQFEVIHSHDTIQVAC